MDTETIELTAIDPAQKRHGISSGLWVYFVIALFIPVLSILFHEMGHWWAHAAFGYETNQLWYLGVSVGSPPPGVDARLADGLSFAAGAGMSLLLLGLGVLTVVVIGANPLGLGLVLIECVRVAGSFVAGIGNAGLGGVLAGRFGELRYLAAAYDGPAVVGVSLAWLELLLPFAALGFVLRRIDPGRRLLPSAVVLAGLVVGMVVWLAVVGPRLLPE